MAKTDLHDRIWEWKLKNEGLPSMAWDDNAKRIAIAAYNIGLEDGKKERG